MIKNGGEFMQKNNIKQIYFTTNKDLEIYPEYLESGKVFCITLKAKKKKD